MKRSLRVALAIALAASMQLPALAQHGGGGGGHYSAAPRAAAPPPRPAAPPPRPVQQPGFSFPHDPAARPAPAYPAHPIAPPAARPMPPGSRPVAPQGGRTAYRPPQTSSPNYRGVVVTNPNHWGHYGWNHGRVWYPAPIYWGGGFWGPFAVGAATAAVMGSIVYANQTYTSYAINTGSPGATLLSNYGLRQVPCGPPGLVVIYGPNFGIICANPNGRVAAGNYAVNTDNLTLQSQ